MKNIFYLYQFEFPDGHKKSFNVDFDQQSLRSSIVEGADYPDWTQLEYKQCFNCDLTSDDYIYCPLAINLVPIINWCQDLASYNEVSVSVASAERTVHAETTLQQSVSSLLGLIMSSSDCPKMKFLRPLARFHLPFATHEETIFRAVSATFLKNYFDQKDNKNGEDALIKLKQQYSELQNVNRFIAERIRSATKRDAAVNAIVLLDILSKKVSFSIDASLEQIRYLFESTVSEDVA
ncbi:MAG: hypothetical protein QM484_03390 [Woeseiaceae bacterium]